MSAHVCTTESLYAGAIEGSGDCMICGRANVILKYGYVGTLCTFCGQDWSVDFPSGTVRRRRESLGLTRREMAERMGLAVATIKHYENIWPSRPYFEKTLEMVREDASLLEADNETKR